MSPVVWTGRLRPLTQSDMDIRQITPEFFAAPQISAEDIPAIKAAGITRVICNRPDPEVPESHQAAAIEAAVAAAGLQFALCPLTHQNMTPARIAENHTLIENCEGPVLAYCASGTRSTIAWALAAVQYTPVDTVIDAARNAGYELENLRPTLEAAARL